jgi:hypothetical protein
VHQSSACTSRRRSLIRPPNRVDGLTARGKSLSPRKTPENGSGEPRKMGREAFSARRNPEEKTSRPDFPLPIFRSLDHGLLQPVATFTTGC